MLAKNLNSYLKIYRFLFCGADWLFLKNQPSPRKTGKKRGKKIVKGEKMAIGVRGALTTTFAIIVIAAVVVFNTAVTIPAGSEGVYDYFGNVDPKAMTSGFHIINPLGHVTTYSIKTQSYEYVKIEGTLTSEGLTVIPDVSIIYRILPGAPPGIYRNVSGDYFITLITPIFMSTLRDEIKRWTAEDIYTGKASQIQADVQERLQSDPQLTKNGIAIDNVLIRGTILPVEVTNAIEAKIKESQAVDQMKFSVAKQTEENKKIISAAEAQAKANRELAASITPTLVQWSIANAIKDNKNAMWVIGGGTGGMILNPMSPN